MSTQTVTLVNNAFTYPLNNETKFSGNGYDIILRDAFFQTGGETVFRPTVNIIGFLLEKSCQLTLSNEKNLASDVNNEIQGVQFLPAGRPVYLRWTQGRHRFVYYQFDHRVLLGSLLSENELSQRWPACVNILNPFIASGMLRLADILSGKKTIATNHVDLILKTLTMEVLAQALKGVSRDKKNLGAKNNLLDVQGLHTFIDHFNGLPKIEDIARHFNLSPRKLSSLYHNATGRMLRTYLAETRIKKAESLLLGTDMMIKQIAYACSFSSPASFNGAFVTARGVSPAVFRKRGGI